MVSMTAATASAGTGIFLQVEMRLLANHAVEDPFHCGPVWRVLCSFVLLHMQASASVSLRSLERATGVELFAHHVL